MSNSAQVFIVSLIIVALFVGWYVADRVGFFKDINPDKIAVCRIDSTTIELELIDSDYTIGEFSKMKKNDDITQVRIGLIRSDNESNKITFEVDTLKDSRIEIHGKIYQLNEIEICED